MKRTAQRWLPIVACAAVAACGNEPTPVAEQNGVAQRAGAPALADRAHRLFVAAARQLGHLSISRVPAPRRGGSRIIRGSTTTPRSRPTAAGSCSRRSGAAIPISTRSSSTAGGEPRLLIDSAAMEDQVAFSPDGRSIAFVSTASGNADIYVLPFTPQDDAESRGGDATSRTTRAATFGPTSRRTARESRSRRIATRRCRASDLRVHAPARRRRLRHGSRRRQLDGG